MGYCFISWWSKRLMLPLRCCSVMSEYPSVVFPTRTRKYNRENQRVFADYGCWEGVHIDAFENTGTSAVFVKKHRPTHALDNSLSKVVDPRILTPLHDFLTLGEPGPIENLIEDDDVDPTELFKETSVITYSGTKEHLLTFVVDDSVMNLACDYPDIVYGNLSDLTKECVSTKSRSTCPKLLHHLDPTLCDVGKKMLHEIVDKESQTNLLKQYCDRDYTGGCLAYKAFERRANKQIGALICPSGQGLDELAVKLLFINCDGDGVESDNTVGSGTRNDDNCVVPDIKLGPEIRQTVNGRILQTDIAQVENDDVFMFGVRSDYHVMLSSFTSNTLRCDWEENWVDFSDNDQAIVCLGLLKTDGSHRVSSISMNPYIFGECAVATEDGIVRLWNADISNKKSGVSLDSLQVMLNASLAGLRSANHWKEVCFAAHPRQLYITDDEKLCLFDVRTQNSSLSLLDVVESVHAHNHEKIYCIESARSIGNEYQCIVATDYNLFLMDQRHCREPLMQLGTNMSYPPSCIKGSKLCGTENGFEWSSAKWSHSTSAVIVGNQRAQEVYCYQLCKTKRTPTVLDMAPVSTYPYQSVSSPRILDGYRTLSNYIKTRATKFSEYLIRRSSKMLVGLEVIPIPTLHQKQDSSGLLVLQITSVGDIGYQTLHMQDSDTVHDMSNIITGKTSATFSSREVEKNKVKLMEIKRKNYLHWMDAVTTPSDGETAVAVSNKHSVAHKEYNLDPNFMPNTMIEITPPSEHCQVCAAHRNNASSETPDGESCQNCGMCVSDSSKMLEILWTENSILTKTLNNGNENTRLNLMRTEETGEIYSNELGKLIKTTWNTTYEDYWESQRILEERREAEEQLTQNRLTLDLGQRGEGVITASEIQLTSATTGESGSQISSIGTSTKKKTLRTGINSQPLFQSGTLNVDASAKSIAASQLPPHTSSASSSGGSLFSPPHTICNSSTDVTLLTFFAPPKARLAPNVFSSPRKRKHDGLPLSRTSLGF